MKPLKSIVTLLALGFAIGCKDAAPPKLDGPSAVEIIQKVQDAYAAITDYTDTGKAVTEIDMSGMDLSKMPGIPKSLADSPQMKQTMGGKQTVQHDFTLKLARPGSYIIEWELKTPAKLVVSMGKGAVWSDGTSHFLMSFPSQYSEMQNREMALAPSPVGAAANTVPNLFFQGQAGLGKTLLQIARWPDEKLGDDDCYIVEGLVGGMMKVRYWIRKTDHLICQQMAKASKLKFTLTETYSNIQVNQGLKSTDLVFNPPPTAKLIPSPTKQQQK